MFDKKKRSQKISSLPIPSKFGPKEVSSSHHRVLSFTQRFSEKKKKCLYDGGSICGGFCEEWKLVSTNFNQMQVKQIILKDSGGLQAKKRENRGKKAVTIFAFNSPSRQCLAQNSLQMQWIPSRWAFCLQSLADFHDLDQWIHVCWFLTRYFAEKLKNKAFFKSKYRVTRRRSSLYLAMLISSYLFCLIWQRHKINLYKIASRSIFSTDIRAVLLRYWRTKIYF